MKTLTAGAIIFENSNQNKWKMDNETVVVAESYLGHMINFIPSDSSSLMGNIASVYIFTPQNIEVAFKITKQSRDSGRSAPSLFCIKIKNLYVVFQKSQHNSNAAFVVFACHRTQNKLVNKQYM